MIQLREVKKIFIDFDGVTVDSNKFKESAIKNSVYKLLGKSKKNIQAIRYFNINAGISREKKLSLFFNSEEVSRIMKLYAKECNQFFSKATPTRGFKTFVEYIKNYHSYIKLFILSGGERDEIKLFLDKNKLLFFFEDILGSEKSKSIHLEEKLVSNNDIFIGDSKNDLNTSLKVGLKFILIEEYKSLASFPEDSLIKEKVFLNTKNFESLIEYMK